MGNEPDDPTYKIHDFGSPHEFARVFGRERDKWTCWRQIGRTSLCLGNISFNNHGG